MIHIGGTDSWKWLDEESEAEAKMGEHYKKFMYAIFFLKNVLLRGAEEACWAHNPKVLGSKPSGATSFCSILECLFVAAMQHHHRCIWGVLFFFCRWRMVHSGTYMSCGCGYKSDAHHLSFCLLRRSEDQAKATVEIWSTCVRHHDIDYELDSTPTKLKKFRGIKKLISSRTEHNEIAAMISHIESLHIRLTICCFVLLKMKWVVVHTCCGCNTRLICIGFFLPLA